MKKTIFLLLLIAISSAFAQKKDRAATPPIVMIADFEDQKYKNNIGGEFGAWDIEPLDKKSSNSISIDTVNDLPGSTHSLSINYDVKSTLNPLNGLWMRLMYADFSEYDHFTFMIKGDKNKGFTTKIKVEFSKWKDKNKKEKIQTGYVVENITEYWQKVIIPLNKFSGFAAPNKKNEWNNLFEFSINFYSSLADQKTGKIYIDNIAFIKTTTLYPHIYDPVPKYISKNLLNSDNLEWADFLKTRLNGFPSKVKADYNFPDNDHEFLKKIAFDTWKYFENLIDKQTGLPLDFVTISDNPNTIKNSVIGDYTNITNIGLYFMCLAGAAELGFISKEQALIKTQTTIQSLFKLEKYQHYFFNYYDTSTLERTSHFISSVDSGWLIAGLYVIKNYFPDDKNLQESINLLLEPHNFNIFYDKLTGHLSHGLYVNTGEKASYDYGVFYAEPRITSYIGIARNELPLEHWFKMNRVFPPNYLWQNQTPKEYKETECLGIKYKTGYYEYIGEKFFPTWGGSLFEALMPSLILKEKKLAPQGLGKNNLIYTRLHIKHAKKILGYPVWGLSSCSNAEGQYGEYGITQLGAKGYETGVVTPHASLLAIEYTPKETIENLKTMLKLYPDIYGEYGFYDSVEIKTKKVPYKYLALDQGMSFIALANYLTNGKIREYFNKEDIFDKCKELLKAEVL